MDKTIIPLDLSADTRRNAHTFYCTKLGTRPHYAACLAKIDAENQGKLSSLFSDCSQGMRYGQCEARRMRAQENEKGQALFFVERVRGAPGAAQDAPQQPQTQWVTPTPPEPVEPVPAPSAPVGGDFYAAAINAMVSSGAHVKAPVTLTVPIPEAEGIDMKKAFGGEPPKPSKSGNVVLQAQGPIKIEAAAGESLLDIAKKMLAARAAANP